TDEITCFILCVNSLNLKREKIMARKKAGYFAV
ncbi:MAG: hypothetical protein ACI92O_003872, partial [Colwellia sp.]